MQNSHFTANKVPQDLQVATLLTSMVGSTYDRLCDLLAPDDPGTKTLGEISDLLNAKEAQESLITYMGMRLLL